LNAYFPGTSSGFLFWNLVAYAWLLAGISKVRAILSANNIMNRVPNGRILETIQCTQFLPYYDEKISVWLPTSGISRITPLVNGPNNMVSSHGVYFGNDTHQPGDNNRSR